MKIKDIFKLEKQLSDEENIVSKTAFEYCQKELMPRIREANRNEIFDKEIYKEFGSMGF